MAKDWLGRPLPELNVMFGNIDSKIAGYKVRYGLTDDWISKLQSICKNFQAAYAGITAQRATMKDNNKWFDTFFFMVSRRAHRLPRRRLFPLLL